MVNTVLWLIALPFTLSKFHGSITINSLVVVDCVHHGCVCTLTVYSHCVPWLYTIYVYLYCVPSLCTLTVYPQCIPSPCSLNKHPQCKHWLCILAVHPDLAPWMCTLTVYLGCAHWLYQCGMNIICKSEYRYKYILVESFFGIQLKMYFSWNISANMNTYIFCSHFLDAC